MVLEARLNWGRSLQPSEQKKVTTSKFPPVQVAAKLWMTPIVGRMLPGSGKIPFLLSFLTMLISYVAFYKNFKEENKTQPVQSPIPLLKNQ